eukprot:g23392.t1
MVLVRCCFQCDMNVSALGLVVRSINLSEKSEYRWCSLCLSFRFCFQQIAISKDEIGYVAPKPTPAAVPETSSKRKKGHQPHPKKQAKNFVGTGSKAHHSKKKEEETEAHHPLLHRALRGHTNHIQSLSWSHDGHMILTAAKDSTCRVWNIQEDAKGAYTRVNLDYTEATAACFSDDNKRILLAMTDTEPRLRTIKMYPLRATKGASPYVEEEHVTSLQSQHKTDLTCLHMVGPYVLTMTNVPSDTKVHLMDTKGRVVNSVVTNQIQNHEFAVSPDGAFFAVAAHLASVKVWHVSPEGKVALAFTLKGHTRGISSVCFGPDSKTLVTASFDGSWKLWNLNVNWHKLHEEAVCVHTTAVEQSDGAVSLGLIRLARVGQPEGSKMRGFVVALVKGRDILFYSVEGNLIGTVENAHHGGPIKGLVFHPKGELLASYGEDKCVKIWKTMAP